MFFSILLTLAKSDETSVVCSITSILATNFSGIDNKGTPECDDDTFTADVIISFIDPPSEGTLNLTGDATASIDASQLSGSLHTFQITMSADGTPINLTAFFSEQPNCKRINTDSGLGQQNAPLQCANLCTFWGNDGTYPACWPNELEIDECEMSLNYAPDPDHPDHTPIHYVKVVLHIFQKEDPAQLNKWIVDPQDPGNFTEEHLGILRSWFTPNGGANFRMTNLCDDPDDSSPHISDGRIRFINEGIVNQDVFFHPDNKAWGVGITGCSGSPSPYYNTMATKYVDNPSTDHPQYNSLIDPETQNAFHVFITGGKWEPQGMGNSDIPDDDDCYWYCSGGMTSDMGCTISGNIPTNPIQFIFGTYYIWLSQGEQQGPAPECSPDYPIEGDAMLGRNILGEFLHVLGVDHISPRQAHMNHAIGVDGCLDTPFDSDYNLMGCKEGKCGLTKCQLGKMHYSFYKLNPAFERFPVAGGGFSRVQKNCDITDSDIIIKNGESILWNSDRKLRSNVVVESGGVLVIECRVGMPNNANISVEPGGRLYIHGEVYNNCESQRWEGVVVKGNASLAQNILSNQGFVYLTGVIEGANTSIRIEAGGRVYGIGADIRNSGGLLFEPYSFSQLGHFNGCNFTCDGNIYDFGIEPFRHAFLNGVRNINFLGCNFNLTNVPPEQLSNTAGILSNGSNFWVFESEFHGFDTGIHAAGQFSPFNSFSVTDSRFSNNQTGIFSLAMQNFSVIGNTFEVGGEDFKNNNPCGLMVDNCTGYGVRWNTFIGTDNEVTERIGIIIEDSGDDANLIVGNSFDYLDYGNFAQGDNRGNFSGLEYYCNTNEGHNTRDFYVSGTGPNSEGIHINQGNNRATRNTFSHSVAFLDSDFRNDVGLISFNHLGIPSEEPNPNSLSGTGGIIKFQQTNEYRCPVNEPCCKTLSQEEFEQIQTDFFVAENGWQTEKTELSELVDGGDTENLLTQIHEATTLNAGQVIQYLLSISPWLSQQALIAAIGKKQVLTENAIIQILNANPEGLREAPVRQLVKSSFSLLLSDSILANAETGTARKVQENLIGEYRSAMLEKADTLIYDILKDTVELNLELLRLWLQKKQSLEAQYALIASFLSTEDFYSASQKLDTIPILYSLDAHELVEHYYFVTLADFWKEIHMQGKTMAELDSQRVSIVLGIANDSRRRAGAIAQGIINTWYNGHFRVIPYLPSNEEIQERFTKSEDSGIYSEAKYLTIFPNPARNFVYFHWNLPLGIEDANISLADLQGRVLNIIQLTGQKGRQKWNTEGLEHGLYFCRLNLPNGNYYTYKLTLIK